MNTFAFNPIVADGCTDTGNIISYEVGIDSLEPAYFKLSADSINNLLRFTALTGGTVTGPVTITVTGTLPDSVT